MSGITLYDLERSGNCYKIRLMLALLGLEYRAVKADIVDGKMMLPEVLQLNPRGQIPILVDGDAVIWDSMAILVYLARCYGDGHWLPTEPLAEARVMQWLAVSENELLYGLARARVKVLFNRPADVMLSQCHHDASQGLAAMEQRLQGHDWLAADFPTIADIACYPYVSVAHEGEFSLDPYPAVRAWLQRITELPGWVAMRS